MGKPMSKIATMLQVSRTFGVRDGMLRLEYELQRGSGLLSWRMRSVQGWDSWNLKRIAPGACAEEMRTARRDGTRPFFFTDARSIGASIRKVIGLDGEKSVLAEAERILTGDLPFFGAPVFRLRIPAPMVPESSYRPECLTASTLDADAICIARLRRPEIYS